jgi:hypothetical protein
MVKTLLTAAYVQTPLAPLEIPGSKGWYVEAPSVIR